MEELESFGSQDLVEVAKLDPNKSVVKNETGKHRWNIMFCFAFRILQGTAPYRPVYILAGKPCSGKTTHLIPALINALGNFPVYKLDIFSPEAATRPEDECIQVFRAAKREVPSILYIPGIDHFWYSASHTLKLVFRRLVQEIDPSLPLLLLATCDSDPYVPLPLLTIRDADGDELPQELTASFPGTEHPCIFKVEIPSKEDREMFFRLLLGLPELPSVSKTGLSVI
ncbi:ATPase family AAA domain-containing protein 2-like [Protopterus annectens]|uniref:ATPase family AAA domain-containing protein 2-like n=1 Tax=Protopterus annectens TaxID=7888 RepID=UPI001CF9D930|nr:ATPase family AAA domain-containing protein 2-like [Protopterus annectens]